MYLSVYSGVEIHFSTYGVRIFQDGLVRNPLSVLRQVAYMAYTCHKHREDMFRALHSRIERLDALSLCRGKVARLGNLSSRQGVVYSQYSSK